jgi:hypothetical protein
MMRRAAKSEQPRARASLRVVEELFDDELLTLVVMLLSGTFSTRGAYTDPRSGLLGEF